MDFKNLKIFFLAQYERFGIYWIVLLAFLLRLFGRSSSSYGVIGELYRDLIVVNNFIHLGQWPLLGPSSALGGFNFGAIYYYILTPFVWVFNFAPYSAGVVSLVFSVLSVWVLYKLVMLWFNRSDMARLAAFCLAISVYDIQFSYYASNPNTLPFFVLWFLYCLTKVSQGNNQLKYFIGLGLSFGIATQLHATALLLLPLVLMATFFCSKRNFLKKQLLIFILLAGATFIPYFIYEFGHNFSNLTGLTRLGQHNFGLLIKPGSVLASACFWQSWLISRAGFFDFLQDYPIVSSAVIVLMLGLLGAQFYLGEFRKYLKDFCGLISNAGLKILSAWLFIGSLMYLFFQNALHPFYFLALWHLPIILFAWFETFLKNKTPGLFRLSVVLFVLAQVLQLVYFYGQVYRPELNHKNLMQDFSFIKQQANGRSYNVMNQLLDINQFVYYSKITGVEQSVSRVGAQKLFVMCSKKDVGLCDYSYIGYKKTAQWLKNEILIAEYVRN